MAKFADKIAEEMGKDDKPKEGSKKEEDSEGKDEKDSEEEAGKMLLAAIASKDASAVCEAVKNIKSY